MEAAKDNRCKQQAAAAAGVCLSLIGLMSPITHLDDFCARRRRRFASRQAAREAKMTLSVKSYGFKLNKTQI